METLREKIEGLTWEPWIGEQYKSCAKRILVLGESHYLHGDNTCEDIDTDPAYTRIVVGEYVQNPNSGNQGSMYDPIARILQGICFPAEANYTDIWKKIAYMNIIQHVLAEKSGQKKWEDFLAGWKVVLQVIHALRPDCVVCFSTDKMKNRVNFNRLEEFKKDLSFDYTISPNGDTAEKVGGAIVATPGGIKFVDAPEKIPVIFIQHASRIKDFPRWQMILQQNLPDGYPVK